MEYLDAELSILITTDKEIKILNRDYREKDKATDVLSFPLLEGEGGDFAQSNLGDVVISFETAKRQAKDLNVSVPQEINRLLTHGLLHLLGYDHENVTEAEAQKMRDKEEELFNLISTDRL